MQRASYDFNCFNIGIDLLFLFSYFETLNLGLKPRDAASSMRVRAPEYLDILSTGWPKGKVEDSDPVFEMR